MIPLRDDAPRFSTPYVTYFLIALNVVVFSFELAVDPNFFSSMSARPSPELWNLFVTFGLVPANLSGAHSVGTVLLPFFTSMFLHGSWLHIILNMWFLWIFGDNIEDYLGPFRYLVFYLVTGIAANGAQTLFSPDSAGPTIGASGAIAGVMGAYFLLYPSARVLTFFFVFFTWLPAWIVLGYWFLVQFVSGAATSISSAGQSSGGVAFWAHVGGFLAGVALIKLSPKRPQRYRYPDW
jgi:membrane associated rhomboid family serine protease